MAHWINNADSYICSACGYECNNPNKEKYGSKVCPCCNSIMNNGRVNPMNIEVDCHNCTHSGVCKYMDSYLKLVREVQTMNVTLGESHVTPLSEIDFIHSPIIRCKYSCPAKSEVRRDY